MFDGKFLEKYFSPVNVIQTEKFKLIPTLNQLFRVFTSFASANSKSMRGKMAIYCLLKTRHKRFYVLLCISVLPLNIVRIQISHHDWIIYDI